MKAKQESGIHYEVFKGMTNLEETPYLSFGIRVLQKEKVVQEIGDISTRETELGELVSKANLQKLAPIHLKEVLEDFLP